MLRIRLSCGGVRIVIDENFRFMRQVTQRFLHGVLA
jgi:hypothetical protein